MKAINREEVWDRITERLKYYDIKDEDDLSLEKKNVDKIVHLLNDYEFSNILDRIKDPAYLNKFDYASLVFLSDKFKEITIQLENAKEEIDLDEFYKRGEVLDFAELRKVFKAQKLNKKFPNFNFDRYEELFKNPILEITNYEGKVIKYDKFVVKKMMIAVNQMIFSEMDLRIVNTGKEGAGKSLLCSQLMLYIHHFLSEVGLIKYDFEVTKLFFSQLRSLLDTQDDLKDDEYFYISALDEGYELNRGNYRDDDSKSYKDDMRSSRKMLRIDFLNLPQWGELETAITLTRTNFIFYTDMDSNVRTGTVKKGDAYFYIIPRGKVIYSPYQRRNISDEEIINTLSRVAKDKNDTYKGLPKNCLIHKFPFQGIWGFDKDKYDKHIKKENKKRRRAGEIKITDYIGFIIHKKLPAIKHWGTFDMQNKNDKKMYYTIQKWLKKAIEERYILNPEILRKYEELYGAKEE